MKKIAWLFTALLPILFVFSCQKQIAADDTATGGRNPSMSASFTFTATLSAPTSVCLSSGAFTVSTILKKTKDGPGNPPDVVNCANGLLKFYVKIGAGAWTLLSSYADADGTKSISYTPAAAGTYCFKTEWQGNPGANANENAQGNCTSVVHTSNESCVTVEDCGPISCDDEDPLKLTAIIDDITNTTTTSTIKMTFTLTSCKDLNQEIRVQGGATAGGNLGITYQTSSTDGNGVETFGYPKELNNNWVYSWLVPSIQANTPQHFTVTYTRSLLTGCVVSGQWSAKSVGLMDATATAQFCP